ncbi:MAG: YchJ family metal-binding protein [Bdellovibrionota bacterium]
MKTCYCHSEKKFKFCCEPFLKGTQLPLNPEQLMRSRYSAYCLHNMNYIQKTMRGEALKKFNLVESLSSAKKCKWISLKILNTSIEKSSSVGFVEFIAEYSSYGKLCTLHEKSEFHLLNGQWYYVDGITS